MKRIVFFTTFFALALCEKKESVHVTDEKVKEVITNFIEMVPPSFLYTGEKVVTVSSWYDSKQNVYYVSLRNDVPDDCQHIVGSTQLNNDFIVFFLALGGTPPFLNIKYKLECDIQPKKSLLLPEPSRHTETFFCYSKETSEIVDCGN